MFDDIKVNEKYWDILLGNNAHGQGDSVKGLSFARLGACHHDEIKMLIRRLASSSNPKDAAFNQAVLIEYATAAAIRGWYSSLLQFGNVNVSDLLLWRRGRPREPRHLALKPREA